MYVLGEKYIKIENKKSEDHVTLFETCGACKKQIFENLF